jgi:bifunctional non-homologous end joining protein LigD
MMSSRPRSLLPAGFIPPCLPTSAPQPPSGAHWLHEVKHDGFRAIARKDGIQVKIYSRPGNELDNDHTSKPIRRGAGLERAQVELRIIELQLRLRGLLE